jgi:hypothetical protein
LSHKLAFTIIILVGLLSYALGFFTDKARETAVLNANLIAQANLVNDRWGEAMMLTHIYDQLVESPESAKHQLRYALMLMYQDDVRLRGIFVDSHGTDNFAIKTNRVVLDFLRKHPLRECAGKNIEDLVACNIDVLDNDA